MNWNIPPLDATSTFDKLRILMAVALGLVTTLHVQNLLGRDGQGKNHPMQNRPKPDSQGSQGTLSLQPPPQALRFSHGERETRVTGDEPQGTMGRVQTAGEVRCLLPAFLCAHIFIKRETSGYEAAFAHLQKKWREKHGSPRRGDFQSAAWLLTQGKLEARTNVTKKKDRKQG